MYVPGVYEVVHEFNCSMTVALLGLSLYVCGLGLGPMLSAPLSEVRIAIPHFTADQIKAHNLVLGIRAENCLSCHLTSLSIIHSWFCTCRKHTNITSMPNICRHLWWACLGCFWGFICRSVGIENIRTSSISSGYCNVYGSCSRYVDFRSLFLDIETFTNILQGLLLVVTLHKTKDGGGRCMLL